MILVFLISFTSFTGMSQKLISKAIENEAITALSFYPELANARIDFIFKNKIKKSTMQARPSFWSFFKSKNNRKYKILISKKFKIDGQEYLTEDIPKDVMIGWLGHELGHVMDYRNRGRLNLLGFGIKYLFSDSFIKEAERSADSFAVQSGMGSYILMTKNFILENASIPDSYKNRIKKYYLSPEEIMQMVKDKDSTGVLN